MTSMTESQLRAYVVSIMKGWIGWSKISGKHKKIIDIYNSHKPLAVGYRVTYSDPWCATAVSAAFIKAGLTDIGFTECSCSRMINLYKARGRWKEKDSYVPKIGDLIMYDWNDNGIGDNVGAPDHVGMVCSVNGSSLTVIEGNKNNSVGYRNISVNGKYIRGFCVPDYAGKANEMSGSMPNQAKPSAPEYSKKEFIMEIQRAFGARVDGYAGPETLGKTLTLSATINRKHMAIESVQKYLSSLGYISVGKADGIAGPKFTKAVKEFQKNNVCIVDGEITARGKTWKKLLGLE